MATKRKTKKSHRVRQSNQLRFDLSRFDASVLAPATWIPSAEAQAEALAVFEATRPMRSRANAVLAENRREALS